MSGSSYLKHFQHVQETCPDSFDLIGDVLLIEEVKAEEQKTAGGIFLPATGKISQMDGIEANRPTFVRVLLVGNGYYDTKSEDTVPVDVKAGDVILVGKLSVKWLSTFGPIVSSAEAQIGLVRESDIQLQFRGAEGQQKVFTALSDSINAGS